MYLHDTTQSALCLNGNYCSVSTLPIGTYVSTYAHEFLTFLIRLLLHVIKNHGLGTILYGM